MVHAYSDAGWVRYRWGFEAITVGAPVYRGCELYHGKAWGSRIAGGWLGPLQEMDSQIYGK